ncbi:DNA topoisomerase I [Xanthomonas citri pv. fuscans]|uniref:DNA topoisomerase 1 n=1 Tax=Xanthomonas citri pv. fuscans TaxID=366649 RepID=A0AB34Q6J5_XANCI|nr:MULTISPECIES: DNA topoisomerase I [Xanthomonas]ATB60247.1 DNA topoisomerase I, type IA [Xanthomonas citri pv. fuscans]ATS62230.1 DNA topoisomerase I [Xanthomonas citri pv. phaseoli var. fuscans]ATS67688.1 DNA topoisomerase I [Xanthomonas citri pv. phaseoli var. fuscans]ATS72733.1 DNA topoisomerase I [Xanthomonas citri pv. phaseoli var. fuscans]ATS75564.1 DNA topoisomerase I [Xanthomonas citri pv. phaseoli var. fuscans]
MPKHLLIVESPAKAKTINKYLGKDFTVLASYGHVRDLVPKEGAVDPDNGFAMRYDLIEKNEKHVEAIARAAKGADDIFLATDPDREGEAISWHIAEILKERGLLKDKPMQRVVFTEITPRAIKEAMAKPRMIAGDLVDAQQARRALDYLVGFNLSPVLWRKVQRGLSAGRVQSPALRMIVEREEEIEAFIPREYWSIDAHCRHPSQAFSARLIKLDGQKFEQFTVTDGDTAEAARLRIQQAAQGVLHVTDVASKERKRRPAPPFTTSTLQQEASRKLGFTTRKTMQVAQKLYEGVALGDEGSVGLISYMRTDSVNLSQDALAEIRDVIARDFGTASLPDQPNAYTTKSKNAQEAHEAVRPTSALRTPAQVARFLSEDERRLYELIWRRAVACQMIPATLNTVSVDLSAGSEHVFRASGTTVVVPGFLAVYEEGKDTKSSEDEDEGRKLPLMKAGDNVPLDRIVTDQHFTQPPPRYTEAALVKALEEYGIGRPSTYASIIQTLQFRKYVEMEGRSFRPTDVGRAVSKFLSGHFTRYVDYDFTANLEDDLDAVSRGEAEWIPLMEKFWGPFKELVEDKKDSLDKTDAGSVRVLGTDPVSGKEVSARIGRFGPMVQIGTVEDEDKPTFASLRPGQSIYSISIEDALELFKMPRALGQDKDQDVSVGIGRFGPFARRGSTYASLKKEDDPYTIDLARAVFLIEEKEEIARNRVIKEFDSSDIQVLNGRFGPYISDGKLNGKIPKDREPASLTFEEVQQLLADTGKPVRKGFGAKKATLKKNTVKDSAPKKPAVKKTATKTAASKTAVKKAPAKKTATKKAAKRVVKKTVSKAAG